eukprot:TRINITY_DN1753_c0_g1::TRINITY_DN1753_c0_g1_i2::g.25282::m.25282 TRINITY_DN1753_c0_g1::TRINITY_DN1753_c0_g1_i2::g.25282  ORF type:complete len:264 (+),score=4.30,2_5_RNA_ligase2/PF13563.1/1.4e-30,FtsQ/PF03799.10/0.1,FtsQ/PF03799.10/3.5e+03 TRINITY_DN1753_c0_g1_i2:107-898(+)
MDKYKIVPKSALCFIPPKEIFLSIQAIRILRDKSFVRWMPHINIIYPFFHEEHFSDIVPGALKALQSLRPFTVTLNKLQHFKHGKSCTGWLQPEVTGGCDASEDPWQQIFARLLEEFPVLHKHQHHPFVPHLSLGQWSHKEVIQCINELQQNWTPLTFQVKEIHVISRGSFHESFSVKHVIRLGESQPLRIDYPLQTEEGKAAYEYLVSREDDKNAVEADDTNLQRKPILATEDEDENSNKTNNRRLGESQKSDRRRYSRVQR